MLFILSIVNQATQEIVAKFSIRAKLSVYHFGKRSLPLLSNWLPFSKEVQKRSGPSYDVVVMMMMMINYFCDMYDRGKAFSHISSWNYCQSFSPSQNSDTPQAGFESGQNSRVQAFLNEVVQ